MGTAERREREREERRATILEAAREVFLEKGPAQGTMEEVAARAELSKGALYLYFPSKEDLFLALAIRPLNALIEAVESAAAVPASAGLDRLEHLMRAHGASMYADREFFRLAVALKHEQERGGKGAPPQSGPAAAFREGKRRVFQCYLSAIREGQADGSLDAKLEARLLATHCWAAMLGLSVMSVHEARGDAFEEAESLEIAVPAMVDLIVGAARSRAVVAGSEPTGPSRALTKRAAGGGRR